MDKKTVVSILRDEKQDNRQKFSVLLMALNQAPAKNFALTAHYNRVGYSEKNLKAIVYDVKKSYSISPADLSKFEKTPAKKVDIKTTLENLEEELLATEIEELSDLQVKSLAYNLATELEHDFENEDIDSLKEFLQVLKEKLHAELLAKEKEIDSDSEPVQKDKLQLEEYNEELKAMDIENAQYNDIKKLAFGLANEINIDFPNKRADTLKAFLTEQKKSLANEA